jgi:hypothetical protein
MTVFGKRPSEYIEFSRVFLVLILLVGILRLALSLGGAPNSTVRWFTMTGVAWIGIFYLSVRVHTSGFGSYKHLLGVLVPLNLAAQVIAIVGIVIAMVTGTDNIFSAPEYAFGSDGKTWAHLAAHLFIGTTLGSLVPWAFGSLVMFVAKKLTSGTNASRGAREVSARN